MPVMLSVVDDFLNINLCQAPSQEYYPFYQRNIKFISNKTYDLFKIATAALVTSGTATLETALSRY
jgi:lipid-A-disaccharide synthase